MSNIYLSIGLILVIVILNIGGFIIVYRKLGISKNIRASEIEKAESELLEELKQIDFSEIESTSYGQQLLELLKKETPHLLPQISSNQKRGKEKLSLLIDKFVDEQYAEISARVKGGKAKQRKTTQRKTTKIKNSASQSSTND